MTHWIRRLAGFAIVLLAAVPVYRWLPSRETGATGRWTTESVSIQSELLWSGLLLLAIVAMVAGMVVPPQRIERIEGALRRLVLRMPTRAFAAMAGVAGFAATALASALVFERRPNLVDALLQLTHARYFVAGRLAGPGEFADGFWHMQNSLVTDAGWVSQYPPGHIALLAAGFALGAVWLVGPALLGATAAVTTLLMTRLLPHRPVAARLTGIATALSPFLVAHSATFMNHSSAALFGVVAVYGAVRARDGLGWAAGAGAAVAALAAVRPVAGIVVMLVVMLAWWRVEDAPSPRPVFVRRGLAAVAGGVPLLAAHLWYNHATFGAATAFGYTATWGPSHGLGFHRDPWGNEYGWVEALLYTSADLSALNGALLESLLPMVTIAGVFLVVARRLEPGERLLACWALLPVAANAFYWHHGNFMGPRMLAEFGPAWIGLSLVATGELLRRAPATPARGRFIPRVAASALVLAAGVAFLAMAPQRVASYGGDWLPGFRAPLPAAPDNSIVFVHGAWETRLMSRLAASGVRLDQVETAMRQNPTCLVQQHLDRGGAAAFGAARHDLPPLDMTPRAWEYLPRVLVGRDARVRIDTSRRLPPPCEAEVRADRYGAVDASFILWLGDLPGIERGRPMFARDLGPAQNQRLLDRYPERSAWMYGYFDADSTPRLLPWADARRIIWSSEP